MGEGKTTQPISGDGSFLASGRFWHRPPSEPSHEQSLPGQKSGLFATGMWYSNKWVLFSAQDSSSIGCCTRR